ncbi:PREDICTED: uncharacterized protein LOC109156502 [Ipomoea nil]|uniref:uncharacterized protein LOC109156502 n=1 Tax=Ipomoea nil TaxID=35883 RepID=UPI0009008FBE|nr:PREDICTED: uncharacterized protein LOC109156502 [Ipomoea nil]
MDWVSWLSKTTLQPSLVYDYALTFAHNELNQEDIPFFNHEFLQSMGVSVAKHRLEILKLARKEKGRSSNSSSSSSKQKILWLVFAVKQVRKNLAKQVRGWIHREDSAGGSLTIVSARNCSLRWKAAMLKRKKTNNNQEWPPPRMIANVNTTAPRSNNKVLAGQGRLMMLTNGSPLVDHRDAWSYSSASSSPPVENLRYNDDEEERMAGAGDGKYYWSPTIEDIKWDSMFQNLKPT